MDSLRARRLSILLGMVARAYLFAWYMYTLCPRMRTRSPMSGKPSKRFIYAFSRLHLEWLLLPKKDVHVSFSHTMGSFHGSSGRSQISLAVTQDKAVLNSIGDKEQCLIVLEVNVVGRTVAVAEVPGLWFAWCLKRTIFQFCTHFARAL